MIIIENSVIRRSRNRRRGNLLMLLPDQHFGEDSAHSHIRHGRCNSTFQYELLERLIFRVDSIQRGSQSRAFHIDGTSSEQILGRGRRYFTITVDGDSSEVVKRSEE